ncbi:MAG: hypothetical protein JXA98_05750 [Methanosarcinaceae archaeon]|nr:hypothetical protein [Methanosarcinaceae archaeon]
MMVENRESMKKSQKEKNEVKHTSVTNWLLVIATICLVIVGGLQYSATCEVAKSNAILTNITSEHYKYHPPNVSLTNEYIGKMFIYQDNDKTTVTIYGIGSFYNDGKSDDIALARPSSLGEVLKNETVWIVREGNRDSIPIIPSEEPKRIPILVSYQLNESININGRVYISISPDISQIEIIHPLNKTILKNITILSPAYIDFKFGDKLVIVNSDDYNQYIEVIYFDNYDEYVAKKKGLLYEYGYDAVLM